MFLSSFNPPPPQPAANDPGEGRRYPLNSFLCLFYYHHGSSPALHRGVTGVMAGRWQIPNITFKFSLPRDFIAIAKLNVWAEWPATLFLSAVWPTSRATKNNMETQTRMPFATGVYLTAQRKIEGIFFFFGVLWMKEKMLLILFLSFYFFFF